MGHFFQSKLPFDALESVIIFCHRFKSETEPPVYLDLDVQDKCISLAWVQCPVSCGMMDLVSGQGNICQHVTAQSLAS